MATKNTNRHIVDQLGDVRKEIKRLKEIEDDLRSQILEDGKDLTGKEWTVSIVKQSRETLDIKKLKQRFGDKLKPFIKESIIVAVRTYELCNKLDDDYNGQS